MKEKTKKGFFSLFQNVKRFAEPSEMPDTTDDVSPEESPNEVLIETVSDPATQKSSAAVKWRDHINPRSHPIL